MLRRECTPHIHYSKILIYKLVFLGDNVDSHVPTLETLFWVIILAFVDHGSVIEVLFQQVFHKSSKIFFFYKSSKAVNNLSIFYSQNSGNSGDLCNKTNQHINVMVLVIKFRHKVWDKKLRFSFFSLLILYVTRVWNLRVSVYLVVIRQQGYANIANKCNESCLEVGENWVIYVLIFNQYLLDAA